MIGRLNGSLIGVDGSMAIVECAGVGYEVLLPDSVAFTLPPAPCPLVLLTRQVFREDGVTLYGFTETFQRRMFDLLLEVKGCGPRTALALVGQVGEETVAASIVAQDARPLMRATGVGGRLAERILLELKDKIAEENLKRKVAGAVVQATSRKSDELVDALVALGYRQNEAELAAEGARGMADSVEEQLRHALRSLKR